MRDRHLAEDVTQAVFIVLSQKAGKIRPGTVLSNWLFVTTRYAAGTADQESPWLGVWKSWVVPK